MSRSYKDLLKDLNSEVEDRVHALRQGTPANFEDYKKVVGEIQGLEIATARLQEAMKKAESDD